MRDVKLSISIILVASLAVFTVNAERWDIHEKALGAARAYEDKAPDLKYKGAKLGAIISKINPLKFLKSANAVPCRRSLNIFMVCLMHNLALVLKKTPGWNTLCWISRHGQVCTNRT